MQKTFWDFDNSSKQFAQKHKLCETQNFDWNWVQLISSDAKSLQKILLLFSNAYDGFGRLLTP